MAKLKAKSGINIQAARLLIDNNLYASSVHCSYYACLQYVKFLCSHTSGKTYHEIDQDRRVQNINSSHKFLIQKLVGILMNNTNPYSVLSLTEVLKLQSTIKNLKVLRTRSDYHNEYIDKNLSNKAYNKAAVSLRLLKKIA